MKRVTVMSKRGLGLQHHHSYDSIRLTPVGEAFLQACKYE